VKSFALVDRIQVELVHDGGVVDFRWRQRKRKVAGGDVVWG
jgi:hypothetical protein